MIDPLLTLIFSEAALILILSFDSIYRELAIMGLDLVKSGRGPVLVKSVAGAIFLGLMWSVNCIKRIKKKQNLGSGEVDLEDQILLGKHLLQAALLGFSLLLALMIDRLHHYIEEHCLLRKSMEAIKEKQENEDRETGLKIEALEKKIIDLQGKVKEVEDASALKVKQLESECEKKAKEAKVAEASALAMRKQSEGLLLEYDRLLEENGSLQNQLQSIDIKLSRSDRKKNM